MAVAVGGYHHREAPELLEGALSARGHARWTDLQL
jgi:hypothetical protein